jgi:hypothetical protein
MSRSQLLIDLVGGKKDLESILLRLKVILSDLENDSLMKWIDGELKGYALDDVPDYRILKGVPKGNYIVNGIVQHTNANVPLLSLIDYSDYENLIRLKLTNNIASIQNIVGRDKNDSLSKVIPADYYHSISTYSLQITSLNIQFSLLQLDEVTSCVKHKLVEIIMELEKKFEKLDELDIQSQIEADPAKKEVITNKIINIIYDESITIGSGNKISKSEIGHSFEEEGTIENKNR